MGFFHAQLWKLKHSKRSKGKLSSKIHIPITSICPQLRHASIISPLINYRFSKSKMTLFHNDAPILKKHNQTRIHDLPEELLAEILKLLPVKYILHCLCVQKSWYYLIRSPMFITLQLDYQKTPNNHHPKYLYFENAYTDALSLRFDDVQCQEYCTLKTLPGLPQHSWRALLKLTETPLKLEMKLLYFTRTLYSRTRERKYFTERV